jgi:hypothetical protein
MKNRRIIKQISITLILRMMKIVTQKFIEKKLPLGNNEFLL